VKSPNGQWAFCVCPLVISSKTYPHQFILVQLRRSVRALRLFSSLTVQSCWSRRHNSDLVVFILISCGVLMFSRIVYCSADVSLSELSLLYQFHVVYYHVQVVVLYNGSIQHGVSTDDNLLQYHWCLPSLDWRSLHIPR